MLDSRDAAAVNASLPPDAPIRVVRTEHAGLGCYATRRIQPGETVLVERPLVLTVSRSAEHHVCARCLASISARPLRCEGCAPHPPPPPRLHPPLGPPPAVARATAAGCVGRRSARARRAARAPRDEKSSRAESMQVKEQNSKDATERTKHKRRDLVANTLYCNCL